MEYLNFWDPEFTPDIEAEQVGEQYATQAIVYLGRTKDMNFLGKVVLAMGKSMIPNEEGTGPYPYLRQNRDAISAFMAEIARDARFGFAVRDTVERAPFGYVRVHGAPSRQIKAVRLQKAYSEIDGDVTCIRTISRLLMDMFEQVLHGEEAKGEGAAIPCAMPLGPCRQHRDNIAGASMPLTRPKT